MPNRWKAGNPLGGIMSGADARREEKEAELMSVYAVFWCKIISKKVKYFLQFAANECILVELFMTVLQSYLFSKVKALNPSTDEAFRGMQSYQMSRKNVLPMFYLKSKNPRKLFTYKGFRFLTAVRTGLN